jgi:hypothetical protein
MANDCRMATIIYPSQMKSIDYQMRDERYDLLKMLMATTFELVMKEGDPRLTRWDDEHRLLTIETQRFSSSSMVFLQYAAHLRPLVECGFQWEAVWIGNALSETTLRRSADHMNRLLVTRNIEVNC